MAISTLYAVALGGGVVVLVLGTGARMVRYARTPAPLKIPTMPAPRTRSGAMLRLARELLLFESLFKASRWTWFPGWIFHVALLVVVLAHTWLIAPASLFAQAFTPLSRFAALALIGALLALWLRRLAVDRVRYISAPSDHLMLALLLGIATSGALIRHGGVLDVLALQAFIAGLVQLEVNPLPAHPVLLLHLALVAALLWIFPFSKLLHAPGLFFAPTRYQIDDSRERRHAPVPNGRSGPPS